MCKKAQLFSASYKHRNQEKICDFDGVCNSKASRCSVGMENGILNLL